MTIQLDEIQPGYFYEINPNKLSPNHPHQLKQIRILMVSDKTDSSIAVRYPSVFSLRTYFNGGVHTRRDTKRMPALDEKCEMEVSTTTTREVFVKRISGEELEAMKGVLSFWSSTSGIVGGGGGGGNGGVSKKGSCLSELKSSSMVNWGKRRRVRFLSRHEEISNNDNNNNNTPLNNSSSYNLQLLSSSAHDEDEDDQMDLKEEEEVRGGGGGGRDDGSDRSLLLSQKGRKRNRNETKSMIVKNTRGRSDESRRNQAIKVGKRKIVKHSISRWSADRLI